MQTYSFLDVKATIVGAGGSISLGAGSGNAEESVGIEMIEEKSTMMIGADGGVAHSLHASKAGRLVFRFLKTSPTNSKLTTMYNLQTTSSLLHGQNTIVITNIVNGDTYTCQRVAFARFPTNAYNKEANIMEWEFLAGQIDAVLGSNLP